VVIGNILRAARNIRHSGNFSHVFSPIHEEQTEYIDGLMVVSSIFLIAYVLWAFTLVVLKIKGNEVGCASGRAFVTAMSEDEYDEELVGKAEEHLDSTSESSGASSDTPIYRDPQHTRDNNPMNGGQQQTKFANGKSTPTEALEDTQSENRSQSSGWVSRSYSDNHGEDLRDGSEEDETNEIINPREYRTRICFLVFASILLICVPLILVFCYGPLKEATSSSDDLIVVRTICWVWTVRYENSTLLNYSCPLSSLYRVSGIPWVKWRNPLIPSNPPP
jgi:hypothetical protein